MKIIAASIDLTKIDKSRIKTTDKNGVPFKNGQRYYDISIIIKDEADQYGNHAMLSESVTKEERAAKVQGTILGNGKIVFNNSGQEKPQTPVTEAPKTSDGGLPF